MYKKKYGIWGLGVVGKSAIRYLAKKGFLLSVMDTTSPSAEDAAFLESYRAVFFPQSQSGRFFSDNDYLLISPGIDRPNTLPSEKLVEEVDLFCETWSKKLIAVTGSLGKTSTVELLYQIMNSSGYSTARGGNIGTGMLDLLEEQRTIDYAILELSSFQLEHSKNCTPDLALWLNFYPNHLDRHKTIEQYFLAKYALIKNQKPHQKAVVPLSLQQRLLSYTDRPFCFFSSQPFSDGALSSLKSTDVFYGKHRSTIIKITAAKEEVLSSLEDIPRISFEENWIAINAALDILEIKRKSPLSSLKVTIPEHRLEKVATLQGITFYNDSKSSIIEATQAAVDTLQPHKVHLLLGGISKGVDRTVFIPALKSKVASIHCFGKEAATLFQACQKAGISSSFSESLEEACFKSFKAASKNETILFSPAGASFDLFKNYKERGAVFKNIVLNKLGGKVFCKNSTENH